MAMVMCWETPQCKPNLGNTISEHAGRAGDELTEFHSKKGREPNTWYRYKERILLLDDKEYALDDLRYSNRVYKSIGQKISDEQMDVVMEFGRLEVENACNHPKDWVKQDSSACKEFREWHQSIGRRLKGVEPNGLVRTKVIGGTELAIGVPAGA